MNRCVKRGECTVLPVLPSGLLKEWHPRVEALCSQEAGNSERRRPLDKNSLFIMSGVQKPLKSPSQEPGIDPQGTRSPNKKKMSQNVKHSGLADCSLVVRLKTGHLGGLGGPWGHPRVETL